MLCVCVCVCVCVHVDLHRSTNLIEMAKAVRMLAALTPAEADKENLLDAARSVATACAKLLEATEPSQLEVVVLLTSLNLLFSLLLCSFRLRIARSSWLPLEKWAPKEAHC